MNKILLVVLLSLAGCVNGGPCEYEDVPFKATIVSIEKDTLQPYSNPVNKDSTYKVKLVSNVRHHDTLLLSEMLKRNISGSFLTEHQLAEGITMEGTAHLITKGSCAPGSYRFSDSTLSNY